MKVILEFDTDKDMEDLVILIKSIFDETKDDLKEMLKELL